MRRCLFLVVWIATFACEAQLFELDRGYSGRAALCAEVSCDSPPRCADGGSDCLACSCCPCAEGETACDPEQASGRWQCRQGCFVDDPCSAFEVCSDVSGTARCELGPVDCGRIHPYELMEICGQTEPLCAECGGCLTCADIGVGGAFCDLFRPSGDPTTLLSCTSAQGCIEPRSCNAGAECLMGVETGITACSDETTCQEIGCTGFPICGSGPEACGPCGCCTIRDGMPDACGGATVGEGDARFLFNDAELCYDELPCAPGEVCAYDQFDQPICGGG